MVVTAVLKAVSLSGGHTVATELPTSMGIKQSSSLRLTMYVCMYVCIYVCMYVCMYEIRDRQDPVKGSGWVLFPSTMAEQPIQQMVVGHLCFQERAEQ